MLVFQPEFEEEFDIPSTCGETIICLDCSNSMAGSEIHQAKQIALHALDLYRFVATIRVIKFGTSKSSFSSCVTIYSFPFITYISEGPIQIVCSE